MESRDNHYFLFLKLSMNAYHKSQLFLYSSHSFSESYSHLSVISSSLVIGPNKNVGLNSSYRNLIIILIFIEFRLNVFMKRMVITNHIQRLIHEKF
jgi:hypothetical protein